MKVRYFEEASDDQVNWGSNDDPRMYLTLGEVYTLDREEEHSWHTKYYLKEFPDLRFNSVNFEEVNE